MSFPRYPAYKDSGVEWLGEVPEHWNRTSLKFLADYQNGHPFKPDDRGEDGLPIIRISQLTGDDEPAYYSGHLDERIKVRFGDLLFSWSATIDSYIWGKGDAWLNQHIFRVSPSAEASKKYLYYVIKHVAPKLADFDAHGSTMRHIKKESLGEKVYTPSVFEQGLIATFLDHETAKIDALIAEQQRLIELLQEMRQAVISHAVTKGLNPDAPMKDSGVEWLGEVPEHWCVKPLKAEIFFQEGPGIMAVDFMDEGVPLLRISCVQGNKVSLDGCNYLDPQKVNDKWSHFKVVEGDLLLSGSASLGTLSEVGRDVEGSIPYTGLLRIRPLSSQISTDFIRLLIESSLFAIQVDLLKAGATIQHFGPTHLRQMKITLPPLEEQVRIVNEMGNAKAYCNRLIFNANKATELLLERRSALISAAVTGQIDLRGLVPEVAAV